MIRSAPPRPGSVFFRGSPIAEVAARSLTRRFESESSLVGPLLSTVLVVVSSSQSRRSPANSSSD
eukprot:153720-Hanusia_phi.AAC.1